LASETHMWRPLTSETMYIHFKWTKQWDFSKQ
jgi:hypothetical protein